MPDQHAPDRGLDRAWRALHDGGTIQTQLRPVDPAPVMPPWLRRIVTAIEGAVDRVLAPVRHALGWLARFMPHAPWAQILMWGWLAAMAVLLGWVVVDRVRHGQWRWPRWRRRAEDADLPDDLADAPAPPAWLVEADRLAAAGLYAEALHSLLLRCIQDLARRRPQLVQPSATARDLAAAPDIPGPVRALFAEIAGAVEASLFGGRPVALADWERGRTAYRDFAQSWRRRA